MLAYQARGRELLQAGGMAAQMEPEGLMCDAWQVHERQIQLRADASLLHQMQAAENAGLFMAERRLCCANGARRAECSASMLSEMQLDADADLLH